MQIIRDNNKERIDIKRLVVVTNPDLSAFNRVWNYVDKIELNVIKISWFVALESLDLYVPELVFSNCYM